MKKCYIKGIVPFAAAAMLAGCGNNEEEPEIESAENSAGQVQGEQADENDTSNNVEEEEAEEEPAEESAQEDTAVQMAAAAVMENTEGSRIGTVSFYEEDDYVTLEADIDEAEAGFHGFHIHEEAVCEPEDEEPFSSAGGHYSPDGHDHSDHAGDMPPLYVMEDGTAKMSVALDRIEVDKMLEDGVAVIIHEDKDNFAHIPDRYQSEESDEPGPDQDTLDTGDAGDRYACGIVEEVENK